MEPGTKEIVEQLRAIRRWVAVGAIGFVLIGGGAFMFGSSFYVLSTSMEDEIGKSDCSETFRDEAEVLFEKGKSNELIRLAESRMKEYPNDANAYWYRAKGYILNKEWDKALTDLNEVVLLAPNWKEEYVTPLVEEISQRRQQN